MKPLVDDARSNAGSRPWRVEDGRVVLLAYRHRNRDALYFPPLPATSPQLGNTETVGLSGTPTLYSYTVMVPSPKTGKPPMPLGFADFPEGVRVFGRLLYPEGRRPAIGDALQTRLIETDDGEIYAFELLDSERGNPQGNEQRNEPDKECVR
ncbi:Zn-ribbon domain-containing OB-fold protein [Paraburkholderia sp. HD33-4]|uniref:Zn-ribbon domain-containing OB-fold protein n=1 Tax=Paraburkholderia sp. HD33-4 TaxID=2883242 RepID=UPI001F162FBA|nr:OB-fold domain-containing protein [Paraburkholderia sp. HD33-4]